MRVSCYVSYKQCHFVTFWNAESETHMLFREFIPEYGLKFHFNNIIINNKYLDS